MSQLSARNVFETVLYSSDLSATKEFYVNGFGLELLGENELMLVLRIGQSYLLVFDPEKSSIPGRDVPSHGMQGQGHIAFAAAADELDAWRKRLASAGIPIETEVTWPDERGVSVYIRDPAGNSVELAPPGLWSHLHQR